MRRMVVCAAAGLCLAALLAPARAAEPAQKEKSDDSCHGTRIEFVDTPKEAARIARKEQKLVFVLHVSGNFEDPRFT
ncbi:MAG TPA: hypothetical protein VFA26_26330 [Gemmataceae bacterium]|nr:hypothetical protein [Gemmataceae bacterium]